ncbi:50S ribosomal protein L3 N(5)-glutamine methyltransferase [Planctobacterium marinum]|uniref:Ribosomal protein uL3 glutamine methyltransferase n=1 Tax=Planctobacterium marinum TaxID=1631968 RepID=A0AA48I7S0_9ALTE|nr:hypothetical protein MACH26_30510 [Planctobacterium marinum]
MSGDYQLTEQHKNEVKNDLRSVLDLARWTMTQFNLANLYFGHGTDNAWDEALSLIAQVLQLPQPVHEDFLKARLTQSEKQQVLELVQLRVEKRVPLAYLTNQAWFAGLPFYVDERVLVPRSPFAELLANGFSSWLEAPPQQILDMCTGSACIAIAAAYAFPESSVDAVDISDDALQVAEINIQEHQLSARVFPIQSDLFSNLQGQTYDLIICNPPYVDAEDMSDLPQEFHHEPELGLAAGNYGLDLVDNILKNAAQHLSHNGWLFVEVGNSLVHIPAAYPELPLHWVNLELGGDGIFAINKAELVAWNNGEKNS